MRKKNKFIASKIKRQILSHVKIVRLAILATFILILLIIGFLLIRAISKSIIGESIGLARDFALPSTDRILTENGRINILVLGTAGPGRGAMDADMTDTMILASISPSDKKVTTISIPRDIWIPSLKDKINSAYYYGKQKGGVETGMVLARSVVNEVLGVQSDYSVIIDFSSFKDVVDALGGIQVDVKTGFTDNQYPIAGKENDLCNGDPTFACRYMTVTFNPGPQTMNGDQALEFVRSRHAVGSEQGDVAREGRQQLVIQAIVKKALDPHTFTNIATDQKILDILSTKIQTDLTLSEAATLARFGIDSKSNLKSYTIPDNLLFHPLDQTKYSNSFYPYAWVFIPARTDGKWDDVHSWVQSVMP